MANDEYREPQEADREAGLRARHETRLRRAIRREVAEEIAQALDARFEDNLRLANGDSDILPTDGRTGMATGYRRAARIAREIGSKGGSDD
jgi:hypothetical protein